MLLLLLWPVASATTWDVQRDGGGDFTHIHDALSVAVDGDIIEVGPGTYVEALDFDGKAVTIRSTQGSAYTILNAERALTDAVTFTSGEGAGSVLSGFTIHHEDRRGLHIVDASPALSDLLFEDLGEDTIDGGAAWIDGGSPTFQGCAFLRSVGAQGGAMFITGGATVSLDTVSFADSNATQGGSIYLDDGDLVVTDNAFLHSAATNDGGAIHASPGTTLTLSGSTFDSNYAWLGNGMAVFADGATLTFEGGSFHYNRGTNSFTLHQSGTVYLTGGATLTASGTSFDHNNASDGGAIAAEGSWAVALEGCFFGHNTAFKHGGALSLVGLGTLSASNSVFDDCRAMTGGGAIRMEANDVTIEDSTFLYSNGGQLGGGAVLLSVAGDVAVRNSTFAGNHTTGSGGALSVLGATSVTIEGSKITSNLAVSGGALWLESVGSLAVADSEISLNNATAKGAGVALWNTPSVLTRVTMMANTGADEGGAVYAMGHASDDLEIADSKLLGNRATYGGGVWVQAYDAVTVTGSRLSGNTGSTTSDSKTLNGKGGGAFLMGNGVVSLSSNDFLNNSAGHGGGAFTYGNTSVTWTRTLFLDNKASVWGGALHIELEDDVKVLNSDFVNNHAELAGAVVLKLSRGTFVNDIFAHAFDGGGVWTSDVPSDEASSFRYCAWFANSERQFYASTNSTDVDDMHKLDDLPGTVPKGEGNLLADPKFVSYMPWGATYDLRLAGNSALIDHGDPTLLDTDGTRSDIGLFNGTAVRRAVTPPTLSQGCKLDCAHGSIDRGPLGAALGALTLLVARRRRHGGS